MNLLTETLLLMCLPFGTGSRTRGFYKKYPYVVSVKYQEDSKHLCSGSLLDFKWVLTSAKPLEKYKSTPESIIVSRRNQTKAVERIYRNIEFNSRTLQHDIALILLKDSFSKTAFVDVCRIPVYPMEIEMNFKCTEVEVIGFRNYSLTSATYEVMPNEDCKREVSYDPFKVSFCAVTKNTCVNDIGGPAVCEGFVFGVTSKGCNSAVLTRIDRHLKFLVKTMGSSSLLRMPEDEEGKRSNEHLIIAVTTSALVLICVLVILVWSLGSLDKMKCWKVKK